MYKFTLLVVSSLMCILYPNVVFSKNVYHNYDETSFDQGQLIFTHIIYRHGDRTPIDTYPTDPYRNRSFWPEGFGQLTNVGKMQHYELGKFFRKRYASLLDNGIYLRDNVYVQSTNVDRTLMSAEANLASFFPPRNSQVWNDNLDWQPIPVHTAPEQVDYVLSGKRPCSRYTSAFEKYKKTPEYINQLEKYQSLFAYLSRHTGKIVKSIKDARSIYNALFIETLKNYTLPEWTKKVFYPGCELEEVCGFAFQLSTVTPVMGRLKVGFLIKEIFDRFYHKIEGDLNPDRSIWIYSAHDSTIANVLNTLQLFEPHFPPYTATIMFELYKTESDYYVQIFYKNTTSEDLKPLHIPRCGPKCSLGQLNRIYEAILPTRDFETECRISYLTLSRVLIYSTKLVGFIVFAFGCCLLAVTMLWYGMHVYRRPGMYTQID